jgi:hypothetical protein
MSLFGTNTVASHWGWQNRLNESYTILDATFTGNVATTNVGGDEVLNWQFSTDYVPASGNSSGWAYANTGMTGNIWPSVGSSQVSNLFYASSVISPTSTSGNVIISSSTDGTSWTQISNTTIAAGGPLTGKNILVRNGNSVRLFYRCTTSSGFQVPIYIYYADITGNTVTYGNFLLGSYVAERSIVDELGYVGNAGIMYYIFGGVGTMNSINIYKIDNTGNTAGTEINANLAQTKGTGAPSFAYFAGGNTGYKYFIGYTYINSTDTVLSVLKTSQSDTTGWTTRTVTGVDRFTLLCASPTVLLSMARTISTGINGLYRTTNGVNWTLSGTQYTFTTLNYDGSKFIGRASAGPSGAGVYTSVDGITWTKDSTTVEWDINRPDSTGYAELNGASIFRAVSDGAATNYGNVVVGGGAAATSYSITLPAHSTYSTQTITFTPTSGFTPSQQASALGNQITSLRNTYTVSYPSSGLVSIDTNSGANIPDVFQIQNGSAPTGNLQLSITQGSNAATSTRDVITITDPVSSTVYTYSPAFGESIPTLVSGIVSGETLSNWTTVVQTSNSTSGTVRFTSTTTGYTQPSNYPTVVVTPGTNSSLVSSVSTVADGS